MTEKTETRADADGWKDIIEDVTEEFFEFYFPELHCEVDFDSDDLAGSDRTFAVVTQIHLAYLEAGADARKRFDARLALTRRL